MLLISYRSNNLSMLSIPKWADTAMHPFAKSVLLLTSSVPDARQTRQAHLLNKWQ